MMSAEECAAIILETIVKKKRTKVLTLLGKRTVLLSRLFPSLADKLVKKFYFKNGKLVK
jgi:short-subunit dehydrogenase